MVLVRAAIASMLAPLKPREANSATAAARMRARLAFGALGLRMAVVREDKSCVAMVISELADLQVEFNRLVKSTQRYHWRVRDAAPLVHVRSVEVASVAALRLY